MSRVSAIIPVYNGERFVSAAVASVRAQTRPPDEIIVIDDGSTDRTPEILDELAASADISIVRQANAGAAAARNLGVERSTGEILTFLDADDLWVKRKLEWQLAHLEEHPRCEAVSGRVEQFGAGVQESAPIAAHVLPAMAIRRGALERVGPFEAGARSAEYAAWYMRAVECGLRWTMLPQVVLRRRLHDHNSGRTAPEARRQYLLELKRSLDRRRGRSSG